MHLVPLILLRIGFTIVENNLISNLKQALEDDLLAMPGHTSLSTGDSAHELS